jgi:phage protein D
MAQSGKINWRYTETRRRNFLRVLAETYDMEAALTEGRLTWPEVCELRARHPEFAERFEQVIAAGYDRIEALLLRESGLGRGGQIDLALAQALLKQRRAAKVEATAARGRRGSAETARSRNVNHIIKQFELLRAGQGQRGKANANGSGGRNASQAAGRDQ